MLQCGARTRIARSGECAIVGRMLIVFGGLPGVGKSTISRAVAARLGAAYIRIDAIEAAMWAAGIDRAQPTGIGTYAVGHAVAEGTLSVGTPVVVDAVNPVSAARRGWQELAERLSTPLRFVEVVCGDTSEHRRRVESRANDVPGLTYPGWDEILSREFEPWHELRLVIDSAALSGQEAVELVLADIREAEG
jgi:predicted kinase